MHNVSVKSNCKKQKKNILLSNLSIFGEIKNILLIQSDVGEANLTYFIFLYIEVLFFLSQPIDTLREKKLSY